MEKEKYQNVALLLVAFPCFFLLINDKSDVLKKGFC